MAHASSAFSNINSDRDIALNLKKKLLLLLDAGGSTSLLRMLTSEFTAMTINGYTVSDTVASHLNSKKHKMFHEYFPNISCCQCTAATSGKVRLQTNAWTSLFSKDRSIQGCKQSKRTYCLCLCQYQTNYVDLEKLDISSMIFIAKTIAKSDQYVEHLRQTRNQIIHNPFSCSKETEIRSMIDDVKLSMKGIVRKCSPEINNEIDELIRKILHSDATISTIIDSMKALNISEEKRMKVNILFA